MVLHLSEQVSKERLQIHYAHAVAYRGRQERHERDGSDELDYIQ